VDRNERTSICHLLRKIEEEVNDQYFDQEDVIHGILLAILSKQHVALIGPWGEGKTSIITAICNRVGGQFFHWLVGKYTKEDELVGPVAIKKYFEEGSFEHVIDQKMPVADVVFLDEIFKTNPGLLNMNLDMMENRRFVNGRTTIQVPLMSLIGASNELPKNGDGLEAFWDRFALRYSVKRLSISNYGNRLLDRIEAEARGEIHAFETKITMDELKSAQDMVKRVELGTTREVLIHLWEQLEFQGIDRSTRKFIQAATLIKAEAYFQGRMNVESEDLLILQHVLWNIPEEIDKMRFLVYRTIWPSMAQTEQHALEAAQLLEDYKRLNSSIRISKGLGLLKLFRSYCKDDNFLLEQAKHQQETSFITIFISRIEGAIAWIEDDLDDLKSLKKSG